MSSRVLPFIGPNMSFYSFNLFRFPLLQPKKHSDRLNFEFAIIKCHEMFFFFG